jgi:MFS family permease
MTSLVRGFGALWLGQTVSFVGSSLTGFVLGVWVYQSTGSATQFAIISIAAVLPGVLVSPFAGVLVDRRNRRTLMLAADLAGGATTVVIAILLWTDRLQIWHVFVAAGVGALFATVHFTAFYAMLPLLVPEEQLGRANGLMQMTQALQIAAPVFAGALVGTIGLRGVVLIDLCTMVIGVTLLFAARLSPSATAAPAAGAQVTVREDLGEGWQALRGLPGLLPLTILFGGFNFLFAMAGVLIQPLILSFASPATLGVLMLVGGSGLFVGSLVLSAWGGPRQRVKGITVFLAWGGLAVLLHGMAPSPWLIGVMAPLFLFTLPILNGTAMTLVQTRVPAEVLGRVLATTRMIGQAATPLAYVIAGPLADGLAEPAMADGGALAGSFGAVIGTGDGRGIALIFLGIGAGMLALAVVAAVLPQLRHLDTEPEAKRPTEEDEPAHAPSPA